MTTYFMAKLKASAAIIKRKGAGGSPCLTPLPIENSRVGEPLIMIETEANFRHPEIHSST